MRKIAFASTADRLRIADVYKTSEGEYIVRFYDDGIRNPDADYFTDDKDDALDTADHWINK